MWRSQWNYLTGSLFSLVSITGQKKKWIVGVCASDNFYLAAPPPPRPLIGPKQARYHILWLSDGGDDDAKVEIRVWSQQIKRTQPSNCNTDNSRKVEICESRTKINTLSFQREDVILSFYWYAITLLVIKAKWIGIKLSTNRKYGNGTIHTENPKDTIFNCAFSSVNI